jgi:hypothetical protein
VRPFRFAGAGRDQRDHRRDGERQDDAAQPDPAVLRRDERPRARQRRRRAQSGQEELCSSIGLVPQAAFLFSGTVASNLRFGRPEATDAELWGALEIAHARDFVAAMPGDLEAPIDQGGPTSPEVSVSGCQSPGRW